MPVHKELAMTLRLTFAVCLLCTASAFAIDPPATTRVAPDHASTEVEAALRGYGAAAEGLGIGLYFNAAGQVHLQEAKAQAIKNHYEALDQQSRLKSMRDLKQRELH